ncbi:MAG: hypothetical protein JWM46_261 [Candidatus Kaiserbacteria bacterium]|nr:hypothetical protein [Candidatus Kaiserbacteria bacterium]
MERIPDRTPFKQPLYPHENITPDAANLLQSETKFSQIGSDTETVVRALSQGELTWLYDVGVSLQERAAIAKRLFEDLRLRGVRASVQMLIGEKDGEPVLFSITPSVRRAEEAEKTARAIDEKIEQYNILFDYFEDKFRSKDYYLYDILGEHQYVYGNTKDESEDHWHLVDVDPYIKKDLDIEGLRGQLSGIKTDIEAYAKYPAAAALIAKVDARLAELEAIA